MAAVIIEKIGKTAVITINRADQRNALNLAVWTGLVDAWNELREDNDVWTLVVTGSGDKAFCAGADLKETHERKIAAEKAGEQFLSAMPLITPMRGMDMPKPVIAAINGVAAGGGLELALACDLRVAAEHACLGLPEVSIGLMPAAGGCARLPRLMPYGIALEMLCTGEFMTAQEAHRVGLVNHVVPSGQLMEKALERAEKINANGPLAVRAVKEAAAVNCSMSLADSLCYETLILARLRQTEDSWEGPKAFSEKRKPVFKGR